MGAHRLLLAAVLAVGWLVAAPAAASAEWFTDLYAGWSITGNDEVKLEATPAGGSAVTVSQEADFGSSLTVGGRLGYWFERVDWLGLAVDVSSFGPDGRDGQGQAVKVDVVAVSLLLMVRVPLLRTEEVPKGRLQPYLGVGPGFFHTELSIDFSPVLPQRFSDSALTIGLDLRAGLAWQFHNNVALFGEYRLTSVSPEYEKEAVVVASPFLPIPVDSRTTRTMKTTLDTHHFAVGISFRY